MNTNETNKTQKTLEDLLKELQVESIEKLLKIIQSEECTPQAIEVARKICADHNLQWNSSAGKRTTLALAKALPFPTPETA